MCDRIGTGRLSDDQLNPRVNAISTPDDGPILYFTAECIDSAPSGCPEDDGRRPNHVRNIEKPSLEVTPTALASNLSK